MAGNPLLECHFYVPTVRDSEIADGLPQDLKDWFWLTDQLKQNFLGYTLSPGLFEGAWRSAHSGVDSHDESREYRVAVPQAKLDVLRAILREGCRVFAQQCIYLSIAGVVEFVEPDHGPPTG